METVTEVTFSFHLVDILPDTKNCSIIYLRIDLAGLVTNIGFAKKLLFILQYLSIPSLSEKFRDNVPSTDSLLCWELRSIAPLACSGDILQIFCRNDKDTPSDYLLWLKIFET